MNHDGGQCIRAVPVPGLPRAPAPRCALHQAGPAMPRAPRRAGAPHRLPEHAGPAAAGVPGTPATTPAPPPARCRARGRPPPHARPRAAHAGSASRRPPQGSPPHSSDPAAPTPRPTPARSPARRRAHRLDAAVAGHPPLMLVVGNDHPTGHARQLYGQRRLPRTGSTHQNHDLARCRRPGIEYAPHHRDATTALSHLCRSRNPLQRPPKGVTPFAPSNAAAGERRRVTRSARTNPLRGSR